MLPLLAAVLLAAPARAQVVQRPGYSVEQDQEEASEGEEATEGGAEAASPDPKAQGPAARPAPAPEKAKPGAGAPRGAAGHGPIDSPIVTRCGTPLAKLPKKSGLDAFDLHKAVVAKGVPVADWPITSRLGRVAIGGGQVCTPHSKSGQWPQLDFFGDKATKVEGNMWLFAYIDGRWVGGAGHWLRPGQTCKGTGLDKVGPDVYYNAPPLKTWSPCHGELVGFMVSTPARAGQWGTAERSEVALVRWP